MTENLKKEIEDLKDEIKNLKEEIDNYSINLDEYKHKIDILWGFFIIGSIIGIMSILSLM